VSVPSPLHAASASATDAHNATRPNLPARRPKPTIRHPVDPSNSHVLGRRWLRLTKKPLVPPRRFPRQPRYLARHVRRADRRLCVPASQRVCPCYAWELNRYSPWAQMSVRQDVRDWRQCVPKKSDPMCLECEATPGRVCPASTVQAAAYGTVLLTGLLSALSVPLLVYARSEKYHVPEVRPSIT
jgi:hypothetical protein